MDIQFNMNDMPKRIFTEASHFTQECDSLSTDNNSFDIAIESAHSVISLIDKISEPSVIDEMKSMIKETEKNISKNILMEMYSFKKHHECGDACSHGFCTCKYTNLEKCVPSLITLTSVLTEVITRVSKYKNNFTHDAEEDFEDTLKDLCDMIRDRSGLIYNNVLCKEKSIDAHDFIEEMYLTFRDEDNYLTEEYSGDSLKEYEDAINEHYLGIGDGVKTYNADTIKCLRMFDQAMELLQPDPHYSHDVSKWLSRTREALELYVLRYLFIANIAYAGKADAVHGYLNPNNVSYGAHVHNDEPLELDFDLDDIEDENDDDEEEFNFDLLEEDEAIVESAFDNIDIRDNWIPEYTEDPELYLMEAKLVSILNEELMMIHEATDAEITKARLDYNRKLAMNNKTNKQFKSNDDFMNSTDPDVKKVTDGLKEQKAPAETGKPNETTDKGTTETDKNKKQNDPNKPGWDVEFNEAYKKWVNKQDASADTSKKAFTDSEEGKKVVNDLNAKYNIKQTTQTQQQNQDQTQQNNQTEEKEKKDKKEKAKGILENMWDNIKKFFDKMLVRFGSAAGKYSADARSYVLDDIYKTYSKSEANQAPNLYPQYEGYYDTSVQRVKNLFNNIGNVSFTNKNIFDPNNTNVNYDNSYFISKILPGSNYDGKTPLGEFCKTYFRGGDANTPIKLNNFGPNVPKETFAAMIDLQLSAEMTSNQLAKNINAMISQADKYSEKFIRDFKEEAELPGLIKNHIASVLEEYFDKEDYKAFTEQDQPAQGQQQQTGQQDQQPAEEPEKIKRLRTSLKAYQDVLMNVMASACTTYEVLCNRNKRILKALQSGDPIKNSKEKNQAPVEQNQNDQQQTQQPVQGQQQQQ